ncbi:MAG TPA: RdgB/HAM1 family non-canonical purine NTP pyrophosphatase [Bryobacteraceae bacterium]|nr:RdgB/HAM1 family non-canonical purine NTP pyrophosphatase [Bryobacteraceae bacterium]
MIHLYCATANPDKLREFRMAAAGPSPTPLLAIDPLPGLADLAPCVEDGVSFEQNAILKARYYGKHAPGLLFAEDSGLEADALGGAPGIYSARFAGPQATGEANNRLLLEKLQNAPVRSARYVCVVALVDSGQLLHTFRGTVEGEIAREPRGSNGFGYDPLFYYPPFGCTFGETAPERKWQVSHRGKAFRAMLDWLLAAPTHERSYGTKIS